MDNSIEKEAAKCWDYVFSELGWDENSRMTISHEEFMAFAKHFAEWQKQQMVENAVEGKVDRFCDDDVVAVIYREPRDNDIRGLYIRSNGLQPGDKVKIIIVKEDKL